MVVAVAYVCGRVVLYLSHVFELLCDLRLRLPVVARKSVISLFPVPLIGVWGVAVQGFLGRGRDSIGFSGSTEDERGCCTRGCQQRVLLQGLPRQRIQRWDDPELRALL